MILRSALFERFFDRGTEIGALLAAFREASRTQTSRTVVMSGEAGIGKSRLLAEFGVRIARERGHTIAGSCLEYARTPYGPLADALADEPLARNAAGALREPADPRTPPDDDKLRRFDVVEQALRRVIAMHGTTVLIVEDAHWSDAATLELFHYLGRRLGDVPALLIATVRSEALESSPPLATGIARLIRDGALDLRLGPIPDGTVAQAIRAATPAGMTLAEPSVQRICELAEGRPLVAEELLRGVLDNARTRGDVDPRRIISIRSSIVERMNAFSASEQLALTYAAVIGRDFDTALLARIAARPAGDVLHTLRNARNAQLVEQIGDDRFRFRHALTREVLYRELLTAEARALHATIAAVLEDEFGDAREDEIAYHWWAAQDAARATLWNERAGDRAAGMHAYADAAVRYERALRFAERGAPLRGALLEKATSALVTIGDMERARTLCREAAGERRARSDDDAALRLMLWVARQWYEAGSPDDAFATLQSIRDQLAGHAASPLAYATETTYAAILALQGKADEALATLRAAERLPCAHDASDDFRALNTRGIASVALGNYAGALESYAAASDVAERLGNVDLLLHARNNVADVHVLTGATERALDIYVAARALAGEHGLERLKALFSVSIAHCMLSAGRLDAARTVLRTEVDERTTATAARLWGQSLTLRIHTLAGDDDPWYVAFAECLDDALRLGEPLAVALAAGALAGDALAAGDANAVQTAIDRALFTLTSFEYAYWLLDAVAQAGDGRAVDYGRTLLEIAEHRRNPLGIASRQLFEARVALRSGDADAARAYARQAHDGFAALRFPAERAAALEIAGDAPAALAILRGIGASRAARRFADHGSRSRAGGGDRPSGGAEEPLTRRETEIARALAKGYPSRVVAEQLGIGQRTVETHIAAIYRKLGIKSRAELAVRMNAVATPGT